MRVRFPRIPPDVAVAEPGFRRLAVNQSHVGFKSDRPPQSSGCGARARIAAGSRSLTTEYFNRSGVAEWKGTCLGHTGSGVRFSPPLPISFPASSTVERAAVNRVIVVRFHGGEPNSRTLITKRLNSAKSSKAFFSGSNPPWPDVRRVCTRRRRGESGGSQNLRIVARFSLRLASSFGHIRGFAARIRSRRKGLRDHFNEFFGDIRGALSTSQSRFSSVLWGP